MNPLRAGIEEGRFEFEFVSIQGLHSDAWYKLYFHYNVLEHYWNMKTTIKICFIAVLQGNMEVHATHEYPSKDWIWS